MSPIRFGWVTIGLTVAAFVAAMYMLQFVPRQFFPSSDRTELLVEVTLPQNFNFRQRTGDFAFWLYLFGVLTFWGGISATSGGTALQKAAYCAMNVGFLFLAVFLGRRVFAVFGTIGIAMYLGDLAEKAFKDSLLFPFALSLIGIAIIAFGLYYHRHQVAITAWIDARMPDALKRLRPANNIA